MQLPAAHGAPFQNRNRDSYGTTLEEILVTARRVEDAQRAAVSLNVQSGDSLKTQGKYTLQQILEDVPGIVSVGPATQGGLDYHTSDSPTTRLIIRGIPSNINPSGQSLAAVSPASVYVDELYNGVGIYDVDRIDVLRGPQGTLYGRSATAGTIVVHTRDPDPTMMDGNVAVEIGNYNLQHYTAALNVPLINDALAVRVAANRYSRDGFDSKQGGARRNTDAKVKLLYSPSTVWQLLLGYAYEENTTHSGGSTGYLYNPAIGVNSDSDVTYLSNLPVSEGKDHFHQYWANLQWFFDGATLTYLPALRTWKQDAVIYDSFGTAFIKQPVVTDQDDFLTQELRLSSNPNSKLVWQTGGFYYYNKIHQTNSISWMQNDVLQQRVDATRRTKNIGVFGEASYSIVASMRVTAGLRYDETTVQTSEDFTVNLNRYCNSFLGFQFDSNCPFSTGASPLAGLRNGVTNLQTVTLSAEQGTAKFHNLTYKGRLEYDLTPENLLYASISTGFLPGDVQVLISNNVAKKSVYRDQVLTAYEIGSKNRFLDSSLQVNGSVYHYDYSGFQTWIGAFGNQELVAVPLDINGGEVELMYQFTSADRVGLNLGYTDIRYDHPPAAFTAQVASNRYPYIPPYTANLSYEHRFKFDNNSELTLLGDANWRSGYDTDTMTPTAYAAGAKRYVYQNPVAIGNLNATWVTPNRKLSMTGYVRNVMDTRYKTAVDVQTPPSVPTTITSVTASESDRRTWGLLVIYRM